MTRKRSEAEKSKQRKRLDDSVTEQTTREQGREAAVEAESAPFVDADEVDDELDDGLSGDDDGGDDDLADPEDLLGDDDGGDDETDADEIADLNLTRALRHRMRDGTMTHEANARREDPVKTYLREIGKVPLLTKEGEVELAKAMEIGSYAELSLAVENGRRAGERLKKRRNPTVQEQSEMDELVQKGRDAAELLSSSSFEEKLGSELPAGAAPEELEELVRKGRAARDRLTISNLRLVVSIAKRYMNRGLSFLDLIQEGNMGLMKAVEKFDFTRGYKFSTYATWWIRQAITRAIADQSRTIRVPVHMIETVRELNRVKREYIQSHGSAPTLEDLAELTGMSIDKIKKVESVSQYTASLERPIGEEDEDTLGDFIEDPASPSPTKETFRMFLREQLSRALDQLDEREREILKLRYGLEDGHPRTLKDVSLKFNITRERVRQIEIKAIEKLKHPSRRAELKRFRELLLAEE